MTNPDYERITRVGHAWKEILPGLQGHVCHPFPDTAGDVLISLRITPADSDTGTDGAGP